MQHREFMPALEDDEEHQHSTDLHEEINGTFIFVVLALILTRSTARPCDINGNYLPSHSPPPPLASLNGQAPLSWQPFASRTEFDFAHFHFVEAQSSAGAINTALDLWAAQILKYGEDVPWKNAAELYSTIDSIQHGDAPWKVYKIRYQGPLPAGTPPKWITQTYELCTRDVRTVLHTQLATTDFKNQFNYTPYRQFNGKGRRVWSNLMSGDWAWKQAVHLVTLLNTYLTMENRTTSLKIHLCTAACSYLSERAVTRPRFPLPQVTRNTTPFMLRPEISPT
jgi:hypothetical protein